MVLFLRSVYITHGSFKADVGTLGERKGSSQDIPDPTADNHKAEPSGK